LKGTVTTLTEENATLKTQAAEAQTALKKTLALSAVEKLVASGKIKGDDKDEWVALHMENEARFTKLTANLQSAVKLNTSHGTNAADSSLDDDLGDFNGDAAIAAMSDAVTKYIADNGGPTKVKHGDAVRAVSLSDPRLADNYRKAFALSTAVN
jgi:hypothetical protein